MNTEDQHVDAPEQAAKPSSKLLKSGVDAREAARKSVEVRRERKAARESEAEHDRLTVSARLAVATAKHLSFADLAQLIEDLKERAHSGGHVGNAAAAQLLSLATAAAAGDEDEVDDTDPKRMTPQQRAAYRALVDRALEEAQRMTETDSTDGAEPDGAPLPPE